MSTYLTAPGVPRVRIGVYPKRHGSSSFPREERKATRADVADESLARQPQLIGDVCYADFFVDAAEIGQTRVA